VLRDGKLVASSLPRVAAPLPDHGAVKVGGHSYRIATFTAPDFNDSTVRVAVLSDLAGAGSATSSGRLLAVIVLAGFLVMAFAFAVAVSRSLQSQIARFLDAADGELTFSKPGCRMPCGASARVSPPTSTATPCSTSCWRRRWTASTPPAVGRPCARARGPT
jgi:hypothetical protein